MKIAIIRLSALGDIIQTSIVLQFIKKINPKASIDWFVDERFKDLLQNHSLIDHIYALPLKDKKIQKTLALILKARKNHYDMILDFQGLIKSALSARMLGSNIFGYDKVGLKEAFASNFYEYKLDISYNENVFIRYLSLTSFAFNQEFTLQDIKFKNPCFKADEELKEKLSTILKLSENQHNILIHVGSSEENKIYPKEKLAILCKLIIDNYPESKIFLAWGNDKELKFAQDLVAFNLIAQNQISILPKLNLQELIAVTKIMDLIIGNDSGPTHLAFAMNKPSITIFGATPSQRNAFATPINKIIDSGKKIPNAKYLDKSDFCISRIDEEDILKLVKELLNG
ncbi:lipopolysaccharide heptosyltransferase I [Campylobacter sp. CCS1377]|uniref:Lipopolysaccharide heptosyltransferase 1 n=1 Tax=Campylobacter sp. CCS1377 TaxID=3158229 RepID=A0AAU7E819_9BACT